MPHEACTVSHSKSCLPIQPHGVPSSFPGKLGSLVRSVTQGGVEQTWGVGGNSISSEQEICGCLGEQHFLANDLGTDGLDSSYAKLQGSRAPSQDF